MYPTQEDIEKFLNAARQNDHTVLLDLLNTYQANIVNQQGAAGLTVLMWMIIQGQTDLARQMLSHGAHVHIQDDEGRTALMWAAMNGNRDIVELLLKNGADADQQTLNGLTPLMYAARHGHYEVALMLIQTSSNALNARDRNGNTALTHARLGRRPEIVKALEALVRAQELRQEEAERLKIRRELEKKQAERAVTEQRLQTLKKHRPPKPNLKKPPLT